MHGLIFAYKSKALRSCTFTERKPVPIGVVTGALRAILLTLIDSNTLGGSGVPSSDTTSAPAV